MSGRQDSEHAHHAARKSAAAAGICAIHRQEWYLTLLGDLLLACLMFWISIMRAESSEYGGDRDSDLSVGSEVCDTQMRLSVLEQYARRQPEHVSQQTPLLP